MFLDNPALLTQLTCYDSKLKSYTILQYSPASQVGEYFLWFNQISNRTEAESLKGLTLSVESSVMRTLTEESPGILLSDLVGLIVLDESSKEWGVVDSVVNYGAGDIVVIVADSKEYLLGVEYIERVEENRLIVNSLGLL